MNKKISILLALIVAAVVAYVLMNQEKPATTNTEEASTTTEPQTDEVKMEEASTTTEPQTDEVKMEEVVADATDIVADSKAQIQAAAVKMEEVVADAMGIIADSKVGFVYVGPISDHGWSYQHDKGRLAIERELNIKTSYVESVPEGADAERVIRELAASGNEIIFTTSFGYMNPTLKVAKQFPKVKFEHATGYKRADNMSTYSARFYEGRTVLGTIAGMMTKSAVVGYVAPFPIPEVVRGIGAFTLALRKYSPDATVKVIWTNSWYDPGKEGDAAKALIDQGADMIVTHTDSPASLQVAEARGVYGFGQGSDMSAFAPKAHLTAIINNWEGYYVERAKAAMEGSWATGDRWGGLATDMVEMAPYGDAVPAAVAAEADKVREALIAGSMHSFDGPVKNQAGEVIVAQGSALDDGALLGMDWYVEGVEGQLPK